MEVGQEVRQKESAAAVLPEDFFEFLKFWLVSHIQGVDIKYAG